MTTRWLRGEATAAVVTSRWRFDLEVARGTPLREVVAGFPGRSACGAAAWRWTQGMRRASGQFSPERSSPRIRDVRASLQPRPLLRRRRWPRCGCGHPHRRPAGDRFGDAKCHREGRRDRRPSRDGSGRACGVLRVKDHDSVNGTGVWTRGRHCSVVARQTAQSNVHVGDVIAIGRTLLEARQDAASKRHPRLPGPRTAADPRSPTATVGADRVRRDAWRQARRALPCDASGSSRRGARRSHASPWCPHLSAFPIPLARADGRAPSPSAASTRWTWRAP